MKTKILSYWCIFLLCISSNSYAQIVITNKDFSFGTTGRIGAGYSPNADGKTGRQLNLNNQGSLGGRMDQGDYVDFLPAFHFTPVVNGDSVKSTKIDMQARLSFYSGGTFLGNVDSKSNQGMIIALPEAFVEARNIMGSDWDVWAGSRWLRYDDVHIADYFYFDDHSATGWGVIHKNTRFSMFFPAAIDTAASNSTPYSYTNVISGTKSLIYRQREVFILEHIIPFKNNNQKLKLLAEFHNVEKSGNKSVEKYPSDHGWVLGAKLNSNIKTKITGSFNQISLRYGSGIANGGDGGNTQTWRTYGAPDALTKTYKDAYSLTLVEHILLNLSNKWSVNAYAVYTQSKGGAESDNKAVDYYQREIFNKKSEFNTGLRATYYFNNWFHLLSELHFASRKDGTQNSASMTKLVLAPTIVPTAERSVWARPHIRLIAELSRYNNQAMTSLYSPFLQQSGAKRFGTYFGVRTEWWIF
ncbi:Maltoporin precursor [Chryseobacterium sp. MOF25P]|uniref:carbohydrate porin n=1 Tax=unclassified Chryseobacterium TaxID=2593645 RepID=UPI000805E97F|nr:MULTISPECIES: carbohydrate porin [unclassified Chryseobacterium]OBW41914.1 Maltoporin precursor [Chryseobacterium sp. MOF25P]OBW45079.1 Maltoporin precursor [Chryseobacterium sp. BGARF1]